MDRTGRARSRCLVALLLSCLIGIPAARAAWDGTQQIELGDGVSATFAGAPQTETHLFTFYAPDDTKLTVSWKAAKGQTLVVTVLDPQLQPVDAASFLKGKKIKKLPLPARGRHTIQVQTTAGTGRYTLATDAKYPKEYDNSFEGDMAESWEISPDHLTLTFKLRQGVKWDSRAPTNGRLWDSQDVVKSWEKFTAVNPGKSSYAYDATSAPTAPILSLTAPDNRTHQS